MSPFWVWCQILIVLFVIVHVLMVILSGPLNQLRGMITGRVAVEEEAPVAKPKPITRQRAAPAQAAPAGPVDIPY